MNLKTTRNAPSKMNNDLGKISTLIQVDPPKSLFNQEASQKIKDKVNSKH